MKAITLHQPWASLIAGGIKKVETRSWPTSYRGPIAIHAGKAVDGLGCMLFRRELEDMGIVRDADMPTGAVVAIADLVSCERMTRESCAAAEESGEAEYGDWRPGRFAWKFENVRAIEPIPARGQQGLWDWEGGHQ